MLNDTRRRDRLKRIVVVVALFARNNDFEKQSNVNPPGVRNPLSRFYIYKIQFISKSIISFREEYLNGFAKEKRKAIARDQRNETNVTR